MNVTDNVVDLMVARLDELPEHTSSALATAACLGTAFEIPLLAAAHDHSEDSLDDVLDHVRHHTADVRVGQRVEHLLAAPLGT